MGKVRLKAFWRKQQQAVRSEELGNARGGFQLREHLTHTGEYHLVRLQKLLELRFHRDFQQDDDLALRDMISFASRVQDQDIQRELLLLYLNCSPQVQDFLRTGGVVDKSHYIHSVPPKDPD